MAENDNQPTSIKSRRGILTRQGKVNGHRRSRQAAGKMMNATKITSLLLLSSTMSRRTLLFGVLLLFGGGVSAEESSPYYGKDCSWPIHGKNLDCESNDELFGADRRAVYHDFMEGCRRAYDNGKKRGSNRCDATENERIEMNMVQPRSMVNYTQTGFLKVKAPKEAFDLILRYWNRNKNRAALERWPAGNIYTNHWAAPTYMVSVEDVALPGGGLDLKHQIWEAVKPTVEAWTGMEQRPSSQYGIRMYTTGAILNAHVDRMPLVSSCIINVAQDVDEPWPLEVYDRHDRAVNVTMEPGDMVLYESGSLIHGRPFALKGKYFANIFIHFEPTGRPLNDTSNEYLDTLDDYYPPYIVPGSPQSGIWAAENPHGWRRPSPSGPRAQNYAPNREAHVAAATGNLQSLVRIAQRDRRALHRPDENGWMSIHEAARGGYTDIVRFLIKHGADMNVRTGRDGKGNSPLNLALEHWDENADIVTYLHSIGAKDIEASSHYYQEL